MKRLRVKEWPRTRCEDCGDVQVSRLVLCAIADQIFAEISIEVSVMVLAFERVNVALLFSSALRVDLQLLRLIPGLFQHIPIEDSPPTT